MLDTPIASSKEAKTVEPKKVKTEPVVKARVFIEESESNPKVRIIKKAEYPKAPSYLYQLTLWVWSVSEIQFAMELQSKAQAPWALKQYKARFAVFIPGPNEMDEIDD